MSVPIVDLWFCFVHSLQPPQPPGPPTRNTLSDQAQLSAGGQAGAAVMTKVHVPSSIATLQQPLMGVWSRLCGQMDRKTWKGKVRQGISVVS